MKKTLLAGALCAVLAGCNDSTTHTAANDSSGTDAGSSGQSDDTAGQDTGTTGSTDTGGTDSGSGDTGSTDSGSSGSGGTTQSPVISTCTATDVGIEFQGASATLVSDADFGPDKLYDGCVDRAHSWSGDKGTIVTLDAGEVHQMQGVYIWSTFARMEWLKIESSADGLNWVVDWHAVPTKPVGGPVYYGLPQAGSKRYVRVTGFGSSMNSWTNIAEVRWSLSGYGVTGDKVSRSGAHTTFGESNTAFESLTDRLYEISATPYSICPFVDTLTPVNATGHLGEFHQLLEIDSKDVHLFDWDYYPLGIKTESGLVLTQHDEAYEAMNAAEQSVLRFFDPSNANQTQQMHGCLPQRTEEYLWFVDRDAENARS